MDLNIGLKASVNSIPTLMLIMVSADVMHWHNIGVETVVVETSVFVWVCKIYIA